MGQPKGWSPPPPSLAHCPLTRTQRLDGVSEKAVCVGRTPTHVTRNISVQGPELPRQRGWIVKNLIFGARAFYLHPVDPSSHGNAMSSESGEVTWYEHSRGGRLGTHRYVLFLKIYFRGKEHSSRGRGQREIKRGNLQQTPH